MPNPIERTTVNRRAFAGICRLKSGDAVEEHRRDGDQAPQDEPLHFGIVALDPGPESGHIHKQDTGHQKAESDQAELGQVFQIVVMGVNQRIVQPGVFIDGEGGRERPESRPDKREIADHDQDVGPGLRPALLEELVH